jgi:hypothetical protein
MVFTESPSARFRRQQSGSCSQSDLRCGQRMASLAGWRILSHKAVLGKTKLARSTAWIDFRSSPH